MYTREELEPVLAAVKSRYIQWAAIMYEQVDFWKTELEKHTKGHCARVLLLSLLLADMHGLGAEDTDALAAASIFHDSRRLDDYRDIGHGKRAADHYRRWCTDTHRALDARSYISMACHDRPDELGIAAMGKWCPEDPNAVLLYQIFKDADALDRFRLAPDNLDVRYLRTAPSKEMVDFARDLLDLGPERALGLRD